MTHKEEDGGGEVDKEGDVKDEEPSIGGRATFYF